MRNNDIRKEENKNDRPEAYPRPTETDEQLKNQPEYEDQQPNEFNDKSISDIPNIPSPRQSDDPLEETSETSE